MSQVEQLITSCLRTGTMKQSEYEGLMRLIEEDGQIDEHESEQLSRLFAAVEEGKLRILDAVEEDEAEKELEEKKRLEEERRLKRCEEEQNAASVAQAVSTAIERGIMTQAEHDRIMTSIHADGKIDDAEKQQISLLFSAIQSGSIKLVESEREIFGRNTKAVAQLARAKEQAVADDAHRSAGVNECRIEPQEQVSVEDPELESPFDSFSETQESVQVEQVVREEPPEAFFRSTESVTPKAVPQEPVSVGAGGGELDVFMTRARARREGGRSFELQTDRVLDVDLNGKVWMKSGAMVGYYGSIKFTREGYAEHGLGKMLKKAVTGEGAPLTKATGKGNLYLADMGKKISVIELKGHSLIVNGRNLLAFEDTVNWDITYLRQFAAVWAGGFFNVKLSGRGMAAITTHYDPIILRVSPMDPVMTDMNATVAWSGSLSPQFKTDVNVRTLIGRTSGETIQMRFEGDGFVVIQPYEETPVDREEPPKEK